MQKLPAVALRLRAERGLKQFLLGSVLSGMAVALRLRAERGLKHVHPNELLDGAVVALRLRAERGLKLRLDYETRIKQTLRSAFGRSEDWGVEWGQIWS